MKKNLCFLLLVAVTLSGCGMTKFQKDEALAYYNMMGERDIKPFVKIEFADPDKPANIKSIEVYAESSNQIPQFKHSEFDTAAYRLAGQALQVAIPLGGAALLVDSITKHTQAPNINYNQNGANGTLVGASNANSNINGSGNVAGAFVPNAVGGNNTTTTTSTRTMTTTESTTGSGNTTTE